MTGKDEDKKPDEKPEVTDDDKKPDTSEENSDAPVTDGNVSDSDNVVTLEMFNQMQNKLNEFMNTINDSLTKITATQDTLIENSTIHDSDVSDYSDDNDDLIDSDERLKRENKDFIKQLDLVFDNILAKADEVA